MNDYLKDIENITSKLNNGYYHVDNTVYFESVVGTKDKTSFKIQAWSLVDGIWKTC